MQTDRRPRTPRLCLLLLTACLSGPAIAAAPRIEPSDDGPRVTVDGELFTQYRTDLGSKPILWPILGPTGKEMTRGFPMRKAAPGETADHVHHKSLWFGHQLMNGVDYWLEPASKQQGSDQPAVVDVGRPEIANEDDGAVLRSRRRWLAPGGETVCTDETTYRFGADDDSRWIDYQTTISPVGKPLVIGDTKEGLFAVRVADSMRQDAGLGGTIVNDSGQRDADCWGQRACWVDYSGPVDGQLAGIAIMSHPTNDRPRPRWHVRTYGLFAANPIGEKDFPPIEGYRQGTVTAAVGEPLTFRYRVLLHRGGAAEADLASQFEAYCAE
ncbi:hypothetical protein Pla175_49210 [Pirellulimonas nuda]|uniref:Methane oxygenase PmoA n=1 Tax=Pirellulimonas nuda TaxID=2528009 RepID=A0A518DJ76_9BACT|nr:PmoA family protein [Pirellulimonas nuda]QDU91492.1 hypothetical protein Pla175_49210 [Pirellulimonas nuda]